MKINASPIALLLYPKQHKTIEKHEKKIRFADL